MALRPVYDDPVAAVADIPDGAMIALGGFSAALGAPVQIMKAFIETSKAKDLTFIGNGTPQVSLSGRGGEMLTLDPARVRKVIVSFPTSQSRTRVGFGNIFADAIEQGAVELELVPQGTLAERLRAGGAGIPAFFTPTGAGTRFAEGKEQREFEGRQYVMERWLRPDYAFVHAIKGDRLGNLIYRNTARNFNPPMASAARITIAEVDELVEPGEISPYEVVTPGIFVHRIVALNRNGARN
jgi:3-oxoadipate CoA-transferase alpha subunit